MGDVSAIIKCINQGSEDANLRLLPLIYEELHRLASVQMKKERGNHTLSTTALAHEVYLKLLNSSRDTDWRGSRHFYNAASKAMRRILIDHARKRKSLKRGGEANKLEFSDDMLLPKQTNINDFLELNEALDKLESQQKEAAEIVNLRFFAGMSNQQASDHMEISIRKGNMLWSYAKAWLQRELEN